ncbi:MAG TPA: nucleoside triphosphate pyrophosphohydrolase [Myxococcota bacterium]|nr:nucleoside triphosphate pyrophosphohydrolase [Myxococcota bacterium]
MTDRFKRAGEAFEKLCRTMATLRAPGGCPWDREQTLASLKPYLIEEAYETLEAIESGDSAAHREELGDLLLQVVFQAELTQEEGTFGAAEVADAITAKLVRRHPHVFAEASADDAKGALQHWETIKATERPKHKGRLDGVPRALPGLLRAYRTGEKAASVGFDWPDWRGSKAKVEEEWGELEEALGTPEAPEAIRAEMGDMLFALVNLCRHLDIDPEDALRLTIDKFTQRFRHVEAKLAASGRPPQSASLDELNDLWEDAKSLEGTPSR